MTNFLLGIFDGVCSIFGKAVSVLLWLITKAFGTNQFIPSFDFFNSTFVLIKADVMLDFFKKVGIFASLIIFALTFVGMIIDGTTKGEVKQWVPQTFSRFILASVLIAISPQIVDFVSDTTLIVYNAMDEKFGDKELLSSALLDSSSYLAGSLEDAESFGHGIEDLKEGDDAAATRIFESIIGAAIVDGITIATGGTFLGVLMLVGLILDLITLVLIALFYVKLLIELLRRYASWCVIAISFPAACSTIVSYKTEEIFQKYLASLFSESICLVATHFFIKTSTYLLSTMPLNLINGLFIIGWVSIGISLDQFLKDHGFTLSSAGAGLGSAMLSGARDLAILGKSAQGGAGGTLANIAGLTNNTDLGRIASGILGHGMTHGAGLQTMAGSMGHQLLQNLDSDKGIGKAIKTATAGGIDIGRAGISPLTESVARSMDQILKQGGSRNLSTLSDWYNGLSRAEQKDWLNNTVKPRLLAEGNPNGMMNKLGISDASQLELHGIDGKGRAMGHLENALGGCEVAIGTNQSNLSDVLVGDLNDDDHYVSFGGFEPAELGTSGVSVADITGIENDRESGFYDSMDHDVLQNSALSYMPNASVDRLDALKGCEYSQTIDWDDPNALSNSRNYTIGTIEHDGKLKTAYTFSSFDKQGIVHTIQHVYDKNGTRNDINDGNTEHNKHEKG